MSRAPRPAVRPQPLMSATVPAPVTAASAPTLTTQYPHVEAIEDWRAQQSIRLLWDRTYDLEARLQAAQSTIDALTTRSNDQDQEIARVRVSAGEALATALLSPSAKAIAAGLSPGEPATGPGSKSDPIIPMSIDPVVMEGNIKASLYHWGLTNYSTWLAYVVNPFQGGDAKWYQGWDAYMEDRARPSNTAGISSHDLYPLPAVYTTPPPTGYPSGGWG